MSLYVSWIPTVTGALSFDLLGRDSGAFPFKIISKRKGEFTIIYQRRIPPDVNIPLLCIFPMKWRLIFSSWMLYKYKKQRFLENYWAYFDEVRCCKGDKKRLRGVAVIAPKMNVWNVEFIGRWMGEGRINEILEMNSLFVFNFIIYRNGKILIRSCEKNGRAYAYEEDIVNMCYRFIKDALHIHKHHDEDEDNIIRVSKVEGKELQQWPEEVIRSILRYIIRNRYERGYNILGMIPYLKTIANIYKSEAQGHISYPDIKEIENLENSIKYSKDEDRENINSDRWVFGSIVVVFIFLLNIHEYDINYIALDEPGIHKLFVLGVFIIISSILYLWKKISAREYIIKFIHCMFPFIASLSNISVMKKIVKFNNKIKIASIFMSLSLISLLIAYIILK